MAREDHKNSICSNFEELLTKANSITIHHKNLQLLATEIFKTQRNVNPSFMNQVFVEKDTPYTLRSGRNILAPQPNTTGYGIENARLLGAKIWHKLPLWTIKLLASISRDCEEKLYNSYCNKYSYLHKYSFVLKPSKLTK